MEKHYKLSRAEPLERISRFERVSRDYKIYNGYRSENAKAVWSDSNLPMRISGRLLAVSFSYTL